jgi:S1-C subfamily serine protease
MSPAARAGVEIGDRLIAIDGAPINGIDDLQRLLDSTWIGRRCELTVLRRSSLIQLNLRPIEVPTAGA